MQKKSLILFFLLIASSAFPCFSNEDSWPKFDTELAEVVVLSGYVSGGKSLPDEYPSECNNGEWICMDPPPIKFAIEVSEIVYGEVNVEAIQAFTTSHYGLSQFEDDESYLFFLLTDGKDFILPRYHFMTLSYSEEGEEVLPVINLDDEFPGWFPCGVKSLTKEINYGEPFDNVLLPIEIFEEDELEKIKDFSHISKYAVRLLKGIELNDLEEYFKVNPIINGNHHCKEKG